MKTYSQDILPQNQHNNYLSIYGGNNEQLDPKELDLIFVRIKAVIKGFRSYREKNCYRKAEEEQNKERFQHNHNLTLFLLTFREENQNHIGSADICFKRIETSQD
ncbi:hypothetical protein NC653_041168 [Populus alba x Populus x berolinensis]|uniref:Uncharacterized protein n=1 Tax=Populus alba x Populus x berolinensis TaxID=444605 RepID=A0AAD6L7W5_9ROSI|nr:hypothetical protein NC653_041168 [Populus alba x Populus x berolinensis]